MINDVVLEGIIVKTWKYADGLLFRLAYNRDPDLPQKPNNEVQDAVDFVTIRVPKGNLSAPVVEKNFHVRCTISRIAAITSRCFQSWMASAWTTKGVIG